MDMNSLLSGLAESQKSESKGCKCNNGGGGCNNGGGNSIVWIIVLLLIFCSQGQGRGGTVCGCKPKHCKEYCRCGGDEPVGYGGGFGLGGFGGGCGGGSGIWIIILILIFACSGNNGRNNKGCTNNIINLDSCDDE